MKFWKMIAIAALAMMVAGCGSNPSEENVTPTAEPTQEAEVPTTAPTTAPEETLAPTEALVADEYTCYLFAYFTGDGAGQENIFYAVSEDGFFWEELNGGEPVLTSTLGTEGLRDPFIMRSANGKKIYMIATDLHIAQSGDWGMAQNDGSRSIMVWDGKDMVYWSGQRMTEIAVETAGCTWAPEAVYNEATGEYLVHWASRVKEDGYAKQRVYYATTTDFMEFSEPQIWIDYPHDTLDVTVIKEGGYYYRFLKYEENSCVILERATDLLGTWERVSAENVESQAGVEGPAVFELHPEDVVDGKKYVLLLDNYGGVGYYYMVADTLANGEFTKLSTDQYSMPGNKARHGTVLRITQEEYNNLVKRLGN